MWYKLVGRTAVPCDMLDRALMGSSNQIANTLMSILDDQVRVSTVFLRMDHGLGNTEPILFETIVFGGDRNEWKWRYCTYDEAEIGHNAVLKFVQGLIDEDELNRIMYPDDTENKQEEAK